MWLQGDTREIVESNCRLGDNRKFPFFSFGYNQNLLIRLLDNSLSTLKVKWIANITESIKF